VGLKVNDAGGCGLDCRRIGSSGQAVVFTVVNIKYINQHMQTVKYVGYSESKYRLRISLAHPLDCHFAHVQGLPLSIRKPHTPFRETRIMFMFVPVR